MTCKIYLTVSIVFYGVLGYPSVPEIQGLAEARSQLSSQHLRNYDESILSKSVVRRSAVGTNLGHFSHPDITQVITSRPGYSSEYNVRQDAPPSEDDLQRNRRKREADAGEEDDSDMYMEPQGDEAEERQTEEQQEEVEKEQPQEQEAEYEQPRREEAKPSDNDGMSQHFFPSFAPVFPLGHSRPPQLFHQEQFYNKPRSPAPVLRPEYNPFRAYRESSFKVPVIAEEEPTSNNILGSGNFGVIRGGTYYNDEDREETGGLFSPYYSNNGHGRPYAPNPRPQQYSNGDFFANFRDFADINTPTKASFSEFVVVYVNKNATKSETSQAGRPKNIIEQLSLLDKESESSPSNLEKESPPKKLSTHKRKLAILKQERTNKLKKSYLKKKDSPKDSLEPLLALS